MQFCTLKLFVCKCMYTFIYFSPSTRDTHALAQDLRLISGSRKSIESGLKGKIHDHDHKLDKYFETRKLQFTRDIKETKSKENFYQHTVLCNNIAGLIDEVVDSRQIEQNSMLIRIGIDGGGGFMKICLSIFDILQPISNKGKTLAKKFKDSGVKKVFLLAIVPNIPENYWNVKKLWIETGLHTLQRDYTIATDLKLCNILLGLMSHSSLHPCCWCDIDKHNLALEGVVR